MPKFEKNENYKKIPLEKIDYGENVRDERKTLEDPEIPLLAESIRRNGLLQPLVVRPAKESEAGGEEFYEIVAGHRRYFALLHLQKQGENFGLVPCVIQPSGKTKTLQMIENIQRKDLDQKEKENALREMLESGMTQSEIARELSKPLSYVSDILAGANVRQIAEQAGVSTAGITSRALAQLRSIEKEEIPAAVEQLSASGGTNRAATEILHEKRRQEKKSCHGGIPAPEISHEIPAPDFADDSEEDSFDWHFEGVENFLQNEIAQKLCDFWHEYSARFSASELRRKTAYEFCDAAIEHFEGEN